MRLLLAAAVSALIVSTAAAQVRGQIEIDGTMYRLAPGARILSQRNLTVTPNMVTPGAAARFVLDASGQVRTVWLVDDGGGRTGTGPVERTPAN